VTQFHTETRERNTHAQRSARTQSKSWGRNSVLATHLSAAKSRSIAKHWARVNDVVDLFRCEWRNDAVEEDRS
jgi:hypothetical protein